MIASLSALLFAQIPSVRQAVSFVQLAGWWLVALVVQTTHRLKLTGSCRVFDDNEDEAGRQ